VTEPSFTPPRSSSRQAQSWRPSWFWRWKSHTWQSGPTTKALTWVPIVAPLVLLWPAERWLRRRFTKAVLPRPPGCATKSESSPKSTRNIQLYKVQDVRVDQRLAQRLWKVGDLSIETAGEASRLPSATWTTPRRWRTTS